MGHLTSVSFFFGFRILLNKPFPEAFFPLVLRPFYCFMICFYGKMAAPARSCKFLFASGKASAAGGFTTHRPNSARRFCEGKKAERSSKQGVLDEERAPSTAEEFRRVAEEKTLRRSETVEKDAENMSAGSGKGVSPGKGSPKN